MKFKISVFLVSILSISGLNAQPVIKASRTVGGANGADQQTCMLKTSDGGFLVGGQSASSASFNKTDTTRGTTGAFDFWLVKYDSLGKIQIDKTIGGDKDDYLMDIIQTGDGGYLLAGFSTSGSFAEKSEASRGNNDYWIVRLNKNGKILWDRTYGGSGSDVLAAVAQTADGGFILAGSSDSEASGEKSQDSDGGSYDCWLVKIDGLGNKEWDKTLGGTYFDGCNAVFQTADGGYMISGGTDNTFAGSSDYLLIKTDANGNQLWRKLYGGDGMDDQDYCTKMIRTAGSNYLLAGYSDSNMKPGTKSESSKGGLDYWLICVDANGDRIWDKTIGADSDEELTDVIENSEGAFLVSGHTASGISGDKTEPNRNVETGYITQDYWVVKLTENGSIVWDKTLGGGHDEVSGSLLQIDNGSYLVGGYSGSNISGDKKQNTKSGMINQYDFWLVNLLDNVALAVQGSNDAKQNLNNAFSVYPNPVREKIFIKNKGAATYRLYDASGQVLITKSIANSGTIEVNMLAPGSYYLQDVSSNQSQKIMIIK